MGTVAIIPAFDESATVGAVVGALRRLGFPVVVVDDGSADDTAAVAAAAGARVLRLPTNVGVGGALRTGFAYAVRHGWRRAVVVDADLQHDPDAVPELVAAADRTGAQLVIASRFSDGSYRASLLRRRLMKRLAATISRRTGVPLDDVTSGFRVITEPLLSAYAAEYPTEYLGDTVEAILLAHGRGATITQVTARMGPRRGGAATSRLHAGGHLLRVLLAIYLRSWRREPIT